MLEKQSIAVHRFSYIPVTMLVLLSNKDGGNATFSYNGTKIAIHSELN